VSKKGLMSETQRDEKVGSESAAPSRAGRWVPRVAVGLVFIAAIIGFYGLGPNDWLRRDELLRQLEFYRVKVEENPLLVVLVFFAVYVSVTALSLPVALWLSLLAGALFGRWLGTVVVLLAATLGATLAFLATRYLFGDFVRRRFGERLSGVNAGIERDGAYYLFTMRLIPAFPFWLINLGMALTPVRALTFAWVSLVGMLPGTFLYVNAGTELARIRSASDVASPSVIGSLALIGILPLLLRKTLSYRGRAV
jgi:uncharacterized membrane protein YdjX (TVP38/TMEM64 family)